MDVICYLYVSVAYVFFMCLDFLGKGVMVSEWIKYSVIVVLFFHSVWLLKKEKYSILTQRSVISIALFCVLIADYFLLFTNCYVFGIWFFLFVQLCYCVLGTRKKEKMVNLRCEKQMVWVWLAQGIFLMFDWGLIIVVLEYVAFSVFNLSKIWRGYKERKFSVILPLVVTLLFLCDVQVFLWNIWKVSVSGVLIWLFYVPSQVLLEKYGDL